MISNEEIVKILKERKINPPLFKDDKKVLLKSLWILKICKENTPAETLTPSAISYVAYKILDEDINKNSISKAFSRAGKKIKRHQGGFFEILGLGKKELEKIEKDKKTPLKTNISLLFKKIKDKDEKEFINEAINCLKVSKRSTIIMLWCGTLYKIYDKIKKKGLTKFNQAYSSRYSNKKSRPPIIIKLDDFEYYPDSEILLICEDLGIFDRTQRRILNDDCLKLRNMCSHPGKYNPGDHKVNSFIEDILEIVFK